MTIGYQLGKGGTDADRGHPGQWSTERLRWLSDCSGFVCWAWGLDRRQETFPGSWLSTDGILREAATPNRTDPWFEFLDTPELGCLVVYGRAGQKPGHVGIVVDPIPEWDPKEPRLTQPWLKLHVVHCSSGNQRRYGGAIAETNGAIWRMRGKFVRYVRQAPF